MLNELFKVMFVFGVLSFIASCSDEPAPVGIMPPVLNLENPAPDFEFTTFMKKDAEVIKLSDYKGKVIYLDFWASWCIPCKESMPLFNELREHLKTSGFEVIAVNLDDVPEKGKEFLQQYPVNYPVVTAVNDNISTIYQLNGLPTSYLIDRKGVLKYAHQGFRDGDMKKIKKQIWKLLN